MYAWFTLPNATTTMSSIGDYSTSIFDELLPIVYIVAGLIIGGLLVSMVIRSVIRGAGKVLKTGGSSRRKRY